jgi:anti-sigma B factor antagonist
MELNVREKEGITILDIEGEIDLYNAPTLKNIINDLINDRKYEIILNLEKVSYIDSSGIGAIISSLSNLKKYQGALKLLNVQSAVRKVFELTKLISFFEIYSDENEALMSFKR